jgi:hypothetical protein
MAVPRELENAIVDAAAAEISEEDVDASPYGPLFELAVFMAHDYHGYGTFATVYDDVVVVLPIAHHEAFDDGEPETHNRWLGTGAVTARNYHRRINVLEQANQSQTKIAKTRST